MTTIISIRLPSADDGEAVHDRLKTFLDSWPEKPPLRAGNVHSSRMAVSDNFDRYVIIVETDFGRPQNNEIPDIVPEGSEVEILDYKWST
jgi:hypothetical protein